MSPKPNPTPVPKYKLTVAIMGETRSGRTSLMRVLHEAFSTLGYQVDVRDAGKKLAFEQVAAMTDPLANEHYQPELTQVNLVVIDDKDEEEVA